MLLKYEYKNINNKYYLNKFEIENISEYYDDITKISIVKYQGLYRLLMHYFKGKPKDIFIPESYLKEATLNELILFNKPMILTNETNCEYISKNQDNTFNFITESNGKIITLAFSSNDILSYFKNSNVIYAYNVTKSENKVNVYKYHIEKHNIIDNFGIISEFNCNDSNYRKLTFSPLNDSKFTEIADYKSFNKVFNIAPYYIRNYYQESKPIFFYIHNNDEYKLFYDNKKSKIAYDNMIPELSFINDRFITINKFKELDNILYLDIEVDIPSR